MNKVWIVAANQEVARYFKVRKSRGQMPEEISDLLDPSARLRARDLVSDRPGRQAGSAGAHHAVEKRHDVKEQGMIRFAASIGAVLDKARRDGDCERVYLLAEPRVLGQIRQSLDKATLDIVAGESAVNLVKASPAVIREHLPDQL